MEGGAQMSFTPQELALLRLADAAEEQPPAIIVRAPDRRTYWREYRRQVRAAQREAEGRKRYERMTSPTPSKGPMP
jgi:hypothetical protein